MNDLLHREPIQIDAAALMGLVRGKRVLVTGAGGSIGSELCRKVACCEPAQLVLLGHGENSIFTIRAELGAWATCELAPVIADVRDLARLEQVFSRYKPELVFHAAAYKHVPLMEQNIPEAVTNNVLGTAQVLKLAGEYGVERAVFISTDKAVNPSSVMGATKRVAELLVTQAAAHGLSCAAVRFGNVLNSRGSVVPSFLAQIERGGPVTVTHADVSRYFITIPEAAGLVLQAAALGHKGGVFIVDMGEPVYIVDLAAEMIHRSGRRIRLSFTGLRPGEKLTEELIYPHEIPQPTAHASLFFAEGAATDPDLDETVDLLCWLADAGEEPRLLELLRDIVPEYRGAA